MTAFGTVREFKVIDGALVPHVEFNGGLRPVAWATLPGSQAAFVAAIEQIVLFQGPRGGCGKTESLLIDAAQHVGIGMGPECRMLFFRPTFPQLAEGWAIARKLFPKIYPDVKFNETLMTITFPRGEVLTFRPFPDPTAFEDFQGKNIVWAGCDELANYKTSECFLLMLSIMRSTHPMAPKPLHLRAATNTFGVGRDWIMEFFKLTPTPQPTLGPLIPADDMGPARRVITGALAENLPLLYAQPGYAAQVAASATGNEAKKLAWLHAIWAAPPTAFFGEVDWSAVTIPNIEPPSKGRIRISLDWGQTDPNAVVYCYPAKNEDVALPDGRVLHLRKGDVVVLDELYTATKPGVGIRLAPYELADRIKAVVEKHGWDPRILRASGNVADTQIFDPGRNDARASTADDLEKSGLVFEPADKARKLGAVQMLKMLMAAKPPENGVREQPALYICEGCTNLLRSLPNLQRDPDDPDDVDSSGDDHLYDSLRYFLRREGTGVPPMGNNRRWIM